MKAAEKDKLKTRTTRFIHPLSCLSSKKFIFVFLFLAVLLLLAVSQPSCVFRKRKEDIFHSRRVQSGR